MKLVDLQKPLSEMTTEELLERVRQIRHNRFVERPAAKKRVDDAEKAEGRRETKKAGTKVDKLLAGMSTEQIEALLKKLQGSAPSESTTDANDTTGDAGGGREGS